VTGDQFRRIGIVIAPVVFIAVSDLALALLGGLRFVEEPEILLRNSR